VVSCSGTPRHLARRRSPGIEPVTFLLPDNRSYLLSYCPPLAVLTVSMQRVHSFMRVLSGVSAPRRAPPKPIDSSIVLSSTRCHQLTEQVWMDTCTYSAHPLRDALTKCVKAMSKTPLSILLPSPPILHFFPPLKADTLSASLNTVLCVLPPPCRDRLSSFTAGCTAGITPGTPAWLSIVWRQSDSVFIAQQWAPFCRGSRRCHTAVRTFPL